MYFGGYAVTSNTGKRLKMREVFNLVSGRPGGRILRGIGYMIQPSKEDACDMSDRLG